MKKTALIDDCFVVLPKAFKTKKDAENFAIKLQRKQAFFHKAYLLNDPESKKGTLAEQFQGFLSKHEPQESPLIIKLNLKKCVLDEKIHFNQLDDGEVLISFPNNTKNLPIIELDAEKLKSEKSSCSIF